MKKLLNVLYVLSENSYIALIGESARVEFEDGRHCDVPLHTLEGIVCFSYRGMSPALMGKCTEYGIAVSFHTPNGKYLTSIDRISGNVLLRKKQYRVSESESESLPIAKNFIIGKLYNSKYLLLHYARDHALQVDVDSLHKAANYLTNGCDSVCAINSLDVLRGIEGDCAVEYFGVFNELILNNKDCFKFEHRNRRPPTDNVNALLSLAYSTLANECSSALLSVGLDPYVGFMHTDRPGRKSLALDLMEELRSVFADRFVITLINNRILKATNFEQDENGAVSLNDEGIKKFFTEWQLRKKEKLIHPFLKEEISWGLVPYVQALLLARFLRGDLDAYPPFLWK